MIAPTIAAPTALDRATATAARILAGRELTADVRDGSLDGYYGAADPETEAIVATLRCQDCGRVGSLEYRYLVHPVRADRGYTVCGGCGAERQI